MIQEKNIAHNNRVVDERVIIHKDTGEVLDLKIDQTKYKHKFPISFRVFTDYKTIS